MSVKPGPQATPKIPPTYTVNNTATFASDSVNGNAVRIFLAGINSDMSRYLNAGGTYAAGTLTVTPPHWSKLAASS